MTVLAPLTTSYIAGDNEEVHYCSLAPICQPLFALYVFQNMGAEWLTSFILEAIHS